MKVATAIDQDAFRKACGRFATGIAVATVAGMDGQPHGLTVNSFTSVSCSPPLVLICIDYRCAILSHFRTSNWFGVNILASDQKAISVQFSERQDDRFHGLSSVKSANGVPLLYGCVSTMECCVSQIVEAGDHAILIGEVTAASWTDREPLVYYGSRYRSLAPLSPGE